VNDCCMVQCNNPFLVTWKWTNKNFFFNIINPYLSPSHFHTPPFFFHVPKTKIKIIIKRDETKKVKKRIFRWTTSYASAISTLSGWNVVC
jgi:hypothetical protein